MHDQTKKSRPNILSGLIVFGPSKGGFQNLARIANLKFNASMFGFVRDFVLPYCTKVTRLPLETPIGEICKRSVGDRGSEARRMVVV